MLEAKVVERIEAPVDRVFAELGNFRGIRTGAGVLSVDYDGDGIGMTRTLHLDGGRVVERLDSYDEANHSWSYAIINEDSPLPFTNYSAGVQLTDAGDGATTVHWTGRFDAKGVAEEKAVKFACAIYGNAIAGARSALEAS